MNLRPSLLFALCLTTGLPAFAAEPPVPPNRFAAAPAPAERFEVKGMLVERHGGGARALVLIPGLASGGWVWQETAREFAASHTVYVVTLPGFDGRPSLDTLDGNPLETARGALLELVQSRRLVKPVLVGHSLGGTLAIELAASEPGRIGGVVSVDGLPVMPRTENMPLEQRAAMADATRRQMAGLAGPAFAAQQRQYMRTIGMVDMGKADDAARLTARSDPAAVASYIGAVLAQDLRPRLPSITAPVLVLAPYYAPDVAEQGITAGEKLAYYRELMTGTQRLEVAPVGNARHFAMIDQPRAFNDALRGFLNTL
ncbi:MAG: alpha/beta hydrolase [Telluria sp.]